MLLPGNGTADQWLDFLQWQHHFWPSMTPRFASLTPLSDTTFRRDIVNLDWNALARKLYVYKPTGLSRDDLWQLLFVSKHRANPWKEQEYRGANWKEVRAAWEHAQWEIAQFRANGLPFCIESAAAIQGFAIENEAAKNVLRSSKDRHARRWQTKEGTYRIKQQSLPDVRDSGGDVSMGDL